MKFRKKQVVVEAIQWTGVNCKEILAFCPTMVLGTFSTNAVVPTLHGMMNVSKGDWIVKDPMGEFFPCEPRIFEAIYERVLEPVGVEV